MSSLEQICTVLTVRPISLEEVESKNFDRADYSKSITLVPNLLFFLFLYQVEKVKKTLLSLYEAPGESLLQDLLDMNPKGFPNLGWEHRETLKIILEEIFKPHATSLARSAREKAGKLLSYGETTQWYYQNTMLEMGSTLTIKEIEELFRVIILLQDFLDSLKQCETWSPTQSLSSDERVVKLYDGNFADALSA